jgi:hypothetical protein
MPSAQASRITRQTAHHRSHHLDGYPDQVTIIRPRHPLEGSALEVLGWCRRRRELQLMLVLPDGTRSLVPAAWTNLQNAPQPPTLNMPRTFLASRTELLRARTVVNALLRRIDSANTTLPPPSQEDTHAAAELSPAITPGGQRAGMARPRRGKGCSRPETGRDPPPNPPKHWPLPVPFSRRRGCTLEPSRHDQWHRAFCALQDEEQAIGVAKLNAALLLASKDDELMPEYCILGFEPTLRLEGRSQQLQSQED